MTESTADETSDDIMQATYCALCEHGYAGLTMQDIADRSESSKSSLHYHYDTKHDLLLAFLDHLFEDFQTRFVGATDGGDPVDRLAAVLDEALDEEDDETRRDFRTAMLEIKSQAPYDEAFRAHLAEFEEFVRDRVREIIADGVDSGAFRSDADPDETAEFVVTVIDGAHTRAIATDRSVAATRRTLADHLERDLLADDDRTLLADAEVGSA